MAKKQETEEQQAVKNEESQQEAPAQEAPAQEAPAQEAPKGPRRFWIHVRRPMGVQEEGRLVSVNGKNWMIKYNTDVLVPEEVYYVLRDAARAEAERDLFIERLTKGQE